MMWSSSIINIMKIYDPLPVVEVSDFACLRRQVRSTYLVDEVQVFLGGMIMLNFVLNLVQAQMPNMQDGSPEAIAFDNIDLGFTALFTAELAVNMFGTFPREFLGNAWNW